MRAKSKAVREGQENGEIERGRLREGGEREGRREGGRDG